jgi:hypothetical protein
LGRIIPASWMVLRLPVLHQEPSGSNARVNEGTSSECCPRAGDHLRAHQKQRQCLHSTLLVRKTSKKGGTSHMVTPLIYANPSIKWQLSYQNTLHLCR